jgi:hypothetical protein
MANDIPFNNDASQAERREVLKNDVTYHRFGLRDDGPGGRYAKQQEKRSVTGSTDPTYPALPEASPWSQWPPEPVGGDPLGVDVNEMVPVGSPAEIEASERRLAEIEDRLREAERRLEAEERRLSGLEAPEAAGPHSPVTVETSARSTPLRRRS